MCCEHKALMTTCTVKLPAAVAQWAKSLLIGQNACWPDGLRHLTDLGSNPGLEGLDWTSGHARRLNSRTGIEGLSVSSLNCDRPLPVSYTHLTLPTIYSV